MINTIPALLAHRDLQIYLMLGLAAAVAVAVALTLRFVPEKWRGPVQVLVAALLAFAQVALIL